jgi:hypothetical protein
MAVGGALKREPSLCDGTLALWSAGKGESMYIFQGFDFDGDGQPDVYVGRKLSKEEAESLANAWAIAVCVFLALIGLGLVFCAIAAAINGVVASWILLSEWVSTWSASAWIAIGLASFVLLPGLLTLVVLCSSRGLSESLLIAFVVFAILAINN